MIRAILPLLLLGPGLLRAAEPARALDFDRDIAPLLVRRCLDCHSGQAPSGDLDLTRQKGAAAALAGKLDASTLWQRVRDDEMPPKKPLPAVEKELLRRWIASGARWGTDPIDPFRLSTEHRAGYDWWSLQAPRRAPLPGVVAAQRVRNPIDRWILARLEAKKLTLAPEADRRALIRRLTFDLTGLPPTPREVADFLADARPDAYERVVERLLGSAAYGERQARHWLDIVRFGESDGFERDLPRFSAWPYRDWVVRAFNADLPYDEFVRLQLAGDVLRPSQRDALAATGFLVAGAHDIVVPSSDNMRAAMQQDELEDLIGTVGQTFLGLTLHCARCHDHKFDPVSMRDYYRLVASLAGVRHGERTSASEAEQVQLARLGKLVDQLGRDIVAVEQPTRDRLLARKRRERPAGPAPLAAWDFTRGLADEVGRHPARLHGAARLSAEGLVLDGKAAYASTGLLDRDLPEKTLEAWVRLDNLSQRGGGAISVQTPDGNAFDAVVFGEQEPGRWMAGSEFFSRTRSLGGPVEKDGGRLVHVAISYDRNGTISAFRDGLPYGVGYRVSEPRAFRAGTAQVVFGLRHGPVGGNKMLAGTLVRARVYDRALRPEEVAASFGLPVVLPEEVSAHLDPESARRRQVLLEQRATLVAQRDRLQAEVARKIYAVNSQAVGPTHVLLRGNVTTRGERVTPGVLAAVAGQVGVSASGSDVAEGQRRAALAGWITDPRNPLFARVMVNRLWQSHFGQGLVETPSDFGFNGGRPSHPELLDWLAGELVAQRFSLKALHRLMVTSATYRQSSAPNAAALAVDAENRLLWRRTPLRLEAESVRDAMLAVAGGLDRTMGGAPYLDFNTYFFKGTQFYDPLEQVGPAFQRRSLYRMWARGGRNPFLDTFDCPDPSATAPRRAATTTPLQALALFNNAMVFDQAERLAERLRREVGSDPVRQVRQAFQLTFAREADAGELALLVPFVERHGLAALGRVLFNTNEFLQVD
ncbi:MAG: DUF1553 domain-containing protein [Gemmataceae bacterium]